MRIPRLSECVRTASKWTAICRERELPSKPRGGEGARQARHADQPGQDALQRLEIGLYRRRSVHRRLLSRWRDYRAGGEGVEKIDRLNDELLVTIIFRLWFFVRDAKFVLP